jgi:hypothetical protein
MFHLIELYNILPFQFSSFKVYFCFYSFNQNIQKLLGTTLKEEKKRFFTSKITNLMKEKIEVPVKLRFFL